MNESIFETAKRVFTEANSSPPETAKRLRYDYRFTLDDIAKVLVSPEGLNLSAFHATWALFDLHRGLTEGMKALHNAGLSYNDIAVSLNDRRGLGIYAGDIAVVLHDPECLNLSTVETVKILRDGLGLTAGDIAVVLHDPVSVSLNFSDGEVAHTLWEALGCSIPQTAKILQDRIGVEHRKIAKAIWDGIIVPIARDTQEVLVEEIAQALKDGLGLNDSEIADAIKDIGVSKPSSHKTASELKAEKSSSKKGIK